MDKTPKHPVEHVLMFGNKKNAFSPANAMSICQPVDQGTTDQNKYKTIMKTVIQYYNFK